MKASEYIIELQKLINEHGDLQCCSYYEYNNSWRPSRKIVLENGEYWTGEKWIKEKFLKLDDFHHSSCSCGW